MIELLEIKYMLGCMKLTNMIFSQLALWLWLQMTYWIDLYEHNEEEMTSHANIWTTFHFGISDSATIELWTMKVKYWLWDNLLWNNVIPNMTSVELIIDSQLLSTTSI